MTESELPHREWYDIVTGNELTQGDVIRGYPLAVVQTGRAADARPRVFVEHRDVVVLTQTCDIPKPAQTSLLLAQIVSYDDFRKKSGDEVSKPKYRKKLIDNTLPAFFLLRENPEVDFPWSIVSFRDLYTSPKDDVRVFAEGAQPRPRLRSPYREHLSQSYARFAMRVALPATTHDFEQYKPRDGE